MRNLSTFAGIGACTFSLASACAQSASILPERFDEQLVVRIHPRDVRDIQLMQAISADRWTCGPGGQNGEAEYRISTNDLPTLTRAGLPFEVTIPDVQALVDAERSELDDPFRDRGFFDSFPTPDATKAYVDSLVAAYPTFVSRISIGLSLQGREIFGFRLTSPVLPVGGSPRKPVVAIDSLQHAREWITLTSSLYAATQLLTTYNTDPRVRAALDRYEFVFVPIVNPDGYEITWNSDRYWRKNARTISPPVQIVGVDLNRNWSVGWGLNNGSSGGYTSEDYRGKSPFSEPETTVVRDYFLAIPKMAAFIDVHSYAATILRPWAYQWQTPPGYPALMRIGQAMSASVKTKTGVTYGMGGPELLYLASGTTPDWAHGTTGAIAYTMEMYSRSGGFSPSASSIPLSGNEFLLALVSMTEHLCPADLNLDNVVDDTDFTLFVVAYNDLLANAGDLTGDGMTDDSDFSLFVGAYDQLTCQ
ncbi:MAG: M14 family zinc carboxypeptidase [Phycisphaerales bacterium]